MAKTNTVRVLDINADRIRAALRKIEEGSRELDAALAFSTAQGESADDDTATFAAVVGGTVRAFKAAIGG
jgi:hypothetical protein